MVDYILQLILYLLFVIFVIIWIVDFITTERASKIDGFYEKSCFLRPFVGKPIPHAILRIIVIIAASFGVFYIVPLIDNQYPPYPPIFVNSLVVVFLFFLFILNYYFVKTQINNIEVKRSNKNRQ